MKHSFQNNVFDISIVDSIDVKPQISRDPELVYVMEGMIVVFKEGAEWILHENDYILINSEEEHHYVVKEAGLFAIIRMRYSEVADYLGLRSNDILCHSMQDGGVSGRTGRIIQNLIGYYLSEDAADEAKMFAEVYSLLHQLREHSLIRKDEVTGRERDDDDRRQAIIRQFINDNYEHKVTLTDLANATYLSSTYLSRYIKEKFGKTFSEVIMDVRLEHAEKDIVETPWPITRIALENGFPLPASFNKAFRQRYGVAPSVYRKQHINKVNEESTAVVIRSEDTLDQKIQEFIARKRQNYFSSGNNISELSAHVRDGKPFHRFWEVMINGCTIRDLMRAEMQEHILMLWKELHFTHVRIWDLYAPELMLFRDNSKERLNFSRIDSVLDFLHHHKIKPYIELGAKPHILLRNVDDYLIYEERKHMFSTSEEYGRFIDQFVTHCANRYGIEEVEQWYFELWMDTGMEDVESYLDAFDEVYSNIKAVSPNIRVGGPGLSEESAVRLPEILKGWEGRINKPDYISIYAYPYIPPSEHAKQEPRVNDRAQGSNYINVLLDENRQLLWDAGLWKTELHLSEWNFTISSRNIINDSIFKGAYIVKNMLSMIGKTDVVGYWFGTDLFSEFYDSEHLLNGSGGLISKDRICKPAYYGMYFFNRLDRYLLAYNEDAIMSTNRRGNYTIVCHNYKHPSYQYYREKEGSIEASQCAEYFDDDIRQFSFTLRGVEDGVYQIKTRVVDDENGSVLDEWARMGYTDDLTANDIDYLRKICVPRIKVDIVTVSDGVLTLSTQLKANAIAFIHVYHLIKDY